MKTEIALIGNPNSGKTTLFNRLTGKAEKVGNWSGVTVSAVKYPYKKKKNVIICDLPGCYSFNGESKDEIVVKEYFNNTPPNVIINVVDGLNLERSLYLTILLAELNIPMIIAVNMADDLKKSGIDIKLENLEKTFNSPVVEISALKNYGVDRLIKLALENKKAAKFTLPSTLVKTEEDKKLFLRENIKNFINKKTPKIEKFTLRVDKILLGKFTAFPIFFLVIFLIYFLSIKIGGLFGEFLANNFNLLSLGLKNGLLKSGAPSFLISLLTDGVMGGICSVLTFVPQIILLFLFVGILEQSGYMSRVSFILDRLFGFLNLSGKAVVPLVLASGCTVTGITACRAVGSSCERRRLIYVSPFIPCSAKSAVFGWFSYNLFNGSALIATSLYFLGIFSAVLFSFFSSKEKSENSSYAFEIPYLRIPSFSAIFSVVKSKIKDFIIKAGTIILEISITVWALTRIGFSGYVGDNIEKSFLYNIGNILKYLFIPLGFGTWQASVSLISGIFAKEAVVETLQIIAGAGAFSNGASAYSFLIFILLSPPCLASLVTAKKELGDNKSFIKLIFMEFFFAYSISLVFYTAYKICLFYKWLLFIYALAIILIIVLIIRLSKRKKLCKKRQNLN